MNGAVERQQESLKRRWDDEEGGPYSSTVVPFPARLAGRAASRERYRGQSTMKLASSTSIGLLQLSPPLDKEMASAVVPPVTVVLEGRSICHRIHLHKHSSYDSLALALRRLFVDGDGKDGRSTLDLSNAVPGHIVAYEDMEDDLLLAGDLEWKDFVRVAKRIRILPAKASRRKH